MSFFLYNYSIMLTTPSLDYCQCKQPFWQHLLRNPMGSTVLGRRMAGVAFELVNGVYGSVLHFANLNDNNQLLFLCLPQFLTFCSDSWVMPPGGTHSSLQQGCSVNLPYHAPFPSSCMGIQLQKAALFLPVYYHTCAVLNSGSSYLHIPCSDVFVCTLGVFLLHFRFSPCFCAKGRELQTSFTLPCF